MQCHLKTKGARSRRGKSRLTKARISRSLAALLPATRPVLQVHCCHRQAAETHGRPNLLEQPDDNARSRQTSSRGELSRPASAREHAEQSRPASARDPSESRPDSVGDRSPSPGADESLVEQPKRASSTRAEPTGSLSARPEHLARSLSARADLPGSPRAASAARSAPSSRPPSSARSARSSGLGLALAVERLGNLVLPQASTKLCQARKAKTRSLRTLKHTQPHEMLARRHQLWI